jgi:hypothetical protein
LPFADVGLGLFLGVEGAHFHPPFGRLRAAEEGAALRGGGEGVGADVRVSAPASASPKTT